MTKDNQQKSNVALFFMATLVLWLLSVVFQIGFNQRTELLHALGSCCLFQFSNWVIRNSFSRDPLFVNKSVSLLHSTFTSFAVVSILHKQWKTAQEDYGQMFEHEQLIGFAWPGAYTALSISCGYFVYDQFDVLQNQLYNAWFPFILVHHLMLLFSFTLALYCNVGINYLILPLISELHSIFLHVRKLRRMLGIRSAKTKFIKVEWALNWVTFIFARLIPHSLITIKLLTDASKFKQGVELPLALFGMIGLNLLNASLGFDLLSAFKRETIPQNVLTKHK